MELPQHRRVSTLVGTHCWPPCLQDFQFFNQARLTEIYAKESTYETFRWQQTQKKEAALKQVISAFDPDALP